MKSDIDRKLFMEERRQRTRAAFLLSSPVLEEKEAHHGNLSFLTCLSLNSFLRSTSTYMHTHTGIDTKKGEARERRQKIVAHKEKNMVEGQNKQLSARAQHTSARRKRRRRAFSLAVCLIRILVSSVTTRWSLILSHW